MLWYCRFKWQPGVTTNQVRRRVVEQHDAGTLSPQHIRGWYNLAGGGAGFVLVDTDTPQELTAFLQPYMDLVSWDVHAVYERPYWTEATIQELRHAIQREEGGDAPAGA